MLLFLHTLTHRCSYILNTDASRVSLMAVFSLGQEGQEHVTVYYSKL